MPNVRYSVPLAGPLSISGGLGLGGLGAFVVFGGFVANMPLIVGFIVVWIVLTVIVGLIATR